MSLQTSRSYTHSPDINLVDDVGSPPPHSSVRSPMCSRIGLDATVKGKTCLRRQWKTNSSVIQSVAAYVLVTIVSKKPRSTHRLLAINVGN
jgi:hypothetical protein